MFPAALLCLVASAGDFVVALDPGHGGTNLGAAALADGVYEKHVTLDIVRRVQRRLDRRIKVVLCRGQDVLVPVRARVRCANESGAQIFLSVHANASPQGPSRGTQRGFELYVLPVREVDADAQVAALQAEHPADAAWAAHEVRAAAAEALSAARRIQWRLGDALGLDRDRGIKQEGAALDVLQGLRVPGVLVEVGFLDHPEEGPLLTSAAGKEIVAGALVKALEDLRARFVRGKTDPAITGKGTKPSEPARRAK